MNEARDTPTARQRLVVVSNRLPVVVSHQEGGDWQVRPGSGGLVTALAPVLRDRGGLWIGWPGTDDEAALAALRRRGARETGYTLEPVGLSADEVRHYYHGFANEILWPLFHDLPGRCNFDPGHWPHYLRVNQRFAAAVGDATRDDDYVWVQDYHLMLVGRCLRELGIRRSAGYFLHIPFPPLDNFTKLPWRGEVLHALLEYDLLGFQTPRDMRNFLQCVRNLLPHVRVRTRRAAATLELEDRTLQCGAFPIGIDHRRFTDDARSDEVSHRAWVIHERLPERKLALGVDRLDYSKGVPQRIQAIDRALQIYPELRHNMTFIQVLVPSREDVAEYAELRRQIERLVGQVNGRHTESGWTPIHHIYRSLDRQELVAHYRTSEIALVTPLKDGMNLVAKEYCACTLEHGVLILSEFAGAAAQLQGGALLVNPHDVDGVAAALRQAFTMAPEEQHRRMRRMRRAVARQNVFWWVDAFLRAAFARDLSHFPQVEHFVPPMNGVSRGSPATAARASG